MPNVYDILYSLGLGLSAPFWLIKPSARRKVFAALRQRMGRVQRRESDRRAILIHAVSLGEVNATRGLVSGLRQQRSELDIIISTTTETGFARAVELYGQTSGMTVIRYPLDFSSAIRRVLDALRPSAVVLMELELWPNFMLQCRRRDIPVLLVNGRITEPSFRRYRLLGPVTRRMFSRLTVACVQDAVMADRFTALGVPRERIQITGTMKFDTATVANGVDGDREIAAAVGLQEGQCAWVCGSTGPGEEPIVLEQYRKLTSEFPNLRLVIVPRKPERFDEVADLIRSAGFNLLRRSGKPGSSNGASATVILGDTMGELRRFYGLADVVFVGRTLVDLGARQHGSDMIEPAGLAKPVVLGPFTGNFADAMSAFRAASAMVEVTTGDQLGTAVGGLLRDRACAAELGRRARQVVIDGKGATDRHLDVIVRCLGT